MPLPDADPAQLVGASVTSVDGEDVGRIDQVFLDDGSGRPRWITVRTGMLGLGHRFVPLEGADPDGAGLRVPYSKDTIKHAPDVGIDAGHLSSEDERRLTAHYESSRPDDLGGPGESNRRGENSGHDESSVMHENSRHDESSRTDESSARTTNQQNGANL